MMPTPHLSCKTCGHRPEGIFCSIVGAHLEALDSIKSVHNYRRGEIIFYEGNPSLAVYCVYTGRVKLLKAGRKGTEEAIRLLGPGEIFGYRALVANEPYAATAQAVEPSTVCAIPRDGFLDLLRRDCDIALRLLSRLARELRISEEQMISRSQDSVARRTAAFLLSIFSGALGDLQDGSKMTIPLTRIEIAQIIGTSPETLSRTLKELNNKGIIGTKGAEFQILNLRMLRLHGARSISPY
jgi:CRP-like cAMP-binding protein